MLLVTSNKAKGLLYVSFIGTVSPDEFRAAREEMQAQLAGLPPAFRYLADLTSLEFMGLDCTAELAQTMELIGQSQVSLVVRVIPDPAKDIGIGIMTVFHYPKQLRVVTCQKLAEAVQALGL